MPLYDKFWLVSCGTERSAGLVRGMCRNTEQKPIDLSERSSNRPFSQERQSIIWIPRLQGRSEIPHLSILSICRISRCSPSWIQGRPI
jgi:hypothetical protein